MRDYLRATRAGRLSRCYPFTIIDDSWKRNGPGETSFERTSGAKSSAMITIGLFFCFFFFRNIIRRDETTCVRTTSRYCPNHVHIVKTGKWYWATCLSDISDHWVRAPWKTSDMSLQSGRSFHFCGTEKCDRPNNVDYVEGLSQNALRKSIWQSFLQ